MRWKEQAVEVDATGRLPGYADTTVRTFKAPDSLDVRFHEVRAKSALNRVPAASKVPFEWTVNPYRGCLHACSYCLRGDTRILMATGETRALEDLAVGDEIWGTETVHGVRRLVRTVVQDHWESFKPAHRVLLSDGTELVASADHRFLTAAGWRRVAALTARDSLVGVNAAVPAAVGGGDGEAWSGGGRLSSGEAQRVASVEPLGKVIRLYDITTGTGDFIANGVVSHNCFARPTHEYLELGAGKDFEREIVVKVNIPEVLRAELARPSWKGDHVALGTNTDPYQWVEKRYRLMRGIWEAFRDAANPCSILTKSPLLLRDADLLQEIAQRTHVSACLSIPTMDEKAWRASEPHTPHPKARLEAVAELNRLGIPTGVLVAPLMPGINDAPEQVEKVLDACREAGAVSIGGQALFLAGSTKQVFMDWLQGYRPDLVPQYEEMYENRSRLRPADRERVEAPLRKGKRARPKAGPKFARPSEVPRARGPEPDDWPIRDRGVGDTVQSAAEVATGLRRSRAPLTPQQRAAALSGQESLF